MHDARAERTEHTRRAECAGTCRTFRNVSNVLEHVERAGSPPAPPARVAGTARERRAAFMVEVLGYLEDPTSGDGAMKKPTLVAALLTGAGLIVSSAANAQLNLQQFGIGGGNAQGNAAPGAASSGGVSQLLQNYVGANQQVLAGQSSLASAMGLGSAAGQAQQAAGLLNGTPSASQLSQVGSTQQSLSQTLTQAFASRSASTSAAPIDKQSFSDGLASLGKGVSQYSSMQSSLGSVGQMNPSSLLQSGLNPQTAEAASYIAKSAPGQLQSLTSTLSQAVQFATSHGISVPSAASAALKGF
jgi:hypothetical protein